MAFQQEIISLFNECYPDGRITLIGEQGVICEGYKNIAKFSTDRVVLRTKKAIITIEGKCFKIAELTNQYLAIQGVVTSIIRENFGGTNAE